MLIVLLALKRLSANKEGNLVNGGGVVVTERQNEIFKFTIGLYQDHEPVGSKALQDSINSSSATIRNDMAALENRLLRLAHTSMVVNLAWLVFSTSSSIRYP